MSKMQHKKTAQQLIEMSREHSKNGGGTDFDRLGGHYLHLLADTLDDCLSRLDENPILDAILTLDKNEEDKECANALRRAALRISERCYFADGDGSAQQQEREAVLFAIPLFLTIPPGEKVPDAAVDAKSIMESLHRRGLLGKGAQIHVVENLVQGELVSVLPPVGRRGLLHALLQAARQETTLTWSQACVSQREDEQTEAGTLCFVLGCVDTPLDEFSNRLATTFLSMDPTECDQRLRAWTEDFARAMKHKTGAQECRCLPPGLFDQVIPDALINYPNRRKTSLFMVGI